MKESFYQIIGYPGRGCKIFFSDRRFDDFRREIHNVFDLLEIVHGSVLINQQNREGILKKGKDCSHKVMGVRFCLSLIEQELANKPSEKEIKNYSDMIANKMCNQAELKNEVLIYETEAFLFQVRSSLDILVQLLKYIPGFEYLSVGVGFDKESLVFNNQKQERNTARKMIDNGDIEMGNFFNQQINDWINGLNEMRNDIAHRSGLLGFTSFVFDSWSERIIDPLMPNDREVGEYCLDIFKKLLEMYRLIITNFILPKIER